MHSVPNETTNIESGEYGKN